MHSNRIFTLLLLTFLFFESSAQQNEAALRSTSSVADSLDVLHYDIFLTSIDFAAHHLTANTSLWVVPKRSLQDFTLELKDLIVDSVTVNGVYQPMFSQEPDLVHIHVGQTYDQSDTVRLQLWYSGVPFHENWGGFHFSGNYAFNLGVGFESNPHNLGKAWFPCVDDFQDRATYHLSVRLPETMTAISGGNFESVTDTVDGYRVWQWEYIYAIPTYLASVTLGDYVLYEDVFHGTSADVPITIYTRPADTAKVATAFQHLKEILSIFEDRFGPYPFERVGYTGTAIGAMEHVSNISYPNSAITPNLTYEYLYAHELAHMWFGNQVTCASEGDMWLNEGWGTFCQYFFKHDLYDPETYRLEMNDNHYDILKNAHLTDGSYLALVNVPTEYTYGTTVYDKGATVVHTLMNYLGPEVFFPAIQAYVQQFAYQSASTYDLRDFLSSYTGIPMDGFFENWIETPGTPHYSIDSMRVMPSGNQFTTEIFMKQKHKGVDFIGDANRVEVSLVGANWQSFTDSIHFDGLTGKSVKTTDFEPVVAFCDPMDKCSDATTDLTVVVRQTGETPYPDHSFRLYVDALPDSALLRLTHHWAAPDSLHTPQPGLRLSPYRHWQFEGIVPDGTQLRGRFFYSNGPTLDQSLILSATDSVVLLYRPSAADDWQTIDQTHEGLWNIGYIYVDTLQLGQYTLAVWDTTLTGLKPQQKTEETGSLQLYPNPTHHELNLAIADYRQTMISITDSAGRILLNLQPEDEITHINVSDWKIGSYYVSLSKSDGKILDTKTFIVH